MEYALEVKNLKKHFGQVKANDGINLSIKKGEIHAIVGENGAGKTTMVKSLCGLHKPTEGEIIVFNEPVVFNSPENAIKKGIGIVHQHFMLVEALTVLENIILGAEPSRKMMLDKDGARKNIEKICKQYNLEMNLDSRVGDLPVGLQQRVEILKILYRGAKLIILDEPTAVLTPQEIDSLFSILRDLTKKECSIIFITHKLKEVMEVSDTVTVIRDGKSVGSWDIKKVNEKMLANSMVGRDVLLEVKKEKKDSFGEDILIVENLITEKSNSEQAVEGISFTVKEGEIFGIIGVAGNGQEALVESILGLNKIVAGSITLKDGTKGNNFREKSIGCIPSDRLKEGLIKEFSVMENIYLGFQHSSKVLEKGFLSDRKIKKLTKDIIEEYKVKVPEIKASINSLSGGNQQKLIIGRELHSMPKLILAVQPTRGVDIGAIEFIYENILKRRKDNSAILLVSNELEEVLSLSDRIGILFRGRLVGIGCPEDFTKEQIGLMMAGIDVK